MKITVNEKKLDIFDYDDINTVLIKYALTQKLCIPEFLLLEDKDIKLQDGLKIKVGTIFDLLNTDDINELIEKSNLKKIISKYPSISKKEDITMLWIYKKNYIDKIDQRFIKDKLSKVNKFIFTTMEKTKDEYDEYIKKIQNRMIVLKNNINENNKIFNILNKYDDVQMSKLDIERIVLSISLALKNNESIIQVFDALETSSDIPFILLKYGEIEYFKVYKHIKQIPNEWVNYESYDKNGELLKVPDGIYFKFLTVPYNKTFSKQIIFENMYSDGEWTLLNKLYFEFKLKYNIGFETMTRKISNVINCVENDIISSGKINVKGSFSIPNLIFNDVIFADLILNDNIVGNFLSLNDSNKPILEKQRFFAYFSSGKNAMSESQDLNKSMSLIITQNIKNKTSYDVRISKCSNLQQAESFKNIFSKLLSYYIGKIDQIKKEYEQYLPIEDTIKKRKKSKAKKKDSTSANANTDKPEKRYAMLKRVRPDLFNIRLWTTACQAGKQPYIVEPDKVEEKREELRHPHKVLEYEGTFFACGALTEKEEQNEKYAQYTWPGIQQIKNIHSRASKNPKSKKNEKKEEEEEEEEDKKTKYSVCCFEKDRHKDNLEILENIKNAENKEDISPALIGEGSGRPKKKQNTTKKDDVVNIDDIKIFNEREIEVKPKASDKEIDSITMQHILVYNKPLEPGRYGDMPFLWQKILKFCNVEKYLEHYTILRMGVIPENDSILHCLERAFNNQYYMKTVLERKNIVFEVRKKIANDIGKSSAQANRLISSSRQEFYDSSPSQIKDILLDKKKYIDPLYFVSLLETYYKCNIFLFVMNEEFPDGNVITPNASFAYLQKEKDLSLPNILIVMNKTYSHYPYQCDIVGRLEFKKKNILDTQFIHSGNMDFIKYAYILYQKSNNVYIVSKDGYSKYIPL
jgi:hypothetical protein